MPPLPGATTDYQETIDRIIELERSRLTRVETRITEEELQLTGLRDLRRQSDDLAAAIRELSGIHSAFRDKQSSSSASSVLTAVVNTNDRRVSDGEYSLEVVQTAQNHIIASKSFRTGDNAPKITLPKGKILFNLNEETYEFTFNGGDVEAFQSALQDDPTISVALRPEIIKRRENESIFLLSARNPGKDNRVRIIQDTKGITRKLGLFRSNPPIRLPVMSEDLFKKTASLQGLRLLERGRQNTIEVPPQNHLPLTIEKTIDFQKTKNISFSFFLEENNEQINADHLTLTNETGLTPYTVATIEYSTPEKEGKQTGTITSSDIFFNIALIDPYSLSLPPDAQITVHTLTFINDSPDHYYLFSKPIQEKERPSKDRFIPSKTLQKSQNAIIKYQGLSIERPSNNIEDLITGLTFQVRRASTEPVQINIRQDADSILSNVQSFVAGYNDLIEVLNIYLSPDEETLGNPELNETYVDRVGIFAGDFQIAQIKASLRAALTRPYATSSSENAPIFFSQIGFEVAFFTQSSFYIDADQIDFNQNIFLSALDTYGTTINDLFSYDSDGDNLPDSGILIELTTLLSRIQGRQSILAIRETTLGSTLGRLETQREREEERLDERRSKLEEDFSEVQAIQAQQESINSWLKSLQGNSN